MLTAWQCSRCGAAVPIGGGCPFCGGDGLPEQAVGYTEPDGWGFLGGLGRALARLLGRRPRSGSEVGGRSES